ncbi:RNA polymerase sigma factor [Lysobacter sp. LF1]|uniref:RNA polymerase sigma factor n=1 Tax=Lysobacter stagni TaxID=3045172 RepID=A0ABT6XD55_9GAMM|nr:RNA polymerase sigma factor [Lysobacter sp. LF1]MDI9237964.1 RNA polymerase sigma factor [Lysobacter sp. LF1]
MAVHGTLAIDYLALDDAGLAARVRGGDREAFRHVMKRCNQRLFRVARGVVHSDAEAEDVVQEAYVDAFEKFASFRGEASLATWLTRIVLNEAHGRQRRDRPTVEVEELETAQLDAGRIVAFPLASSHADPGATLAREQVRHLLEDAIDELPEGFRLVFVLREIEECSVEETAQALELRPETVKTRLHRARRLLRASLQDTLASMLDDAFPFLGSRCERMTDTVMRRIATRSSPSQD